MTSEEHNTTTTTSSMLVKEGLLSSSISMTENTDAFPLESCFSDAAAMLLTAPLGSSLHSDFLDNQMGLTSTLSCDFLEGSA